MSTPKGTQESDNDGRCHGMNKQGQPCGARATESGYCYLHAHPEMAAQLGRAGGRQNRHVVEGVTTPLSALDTSSGVMAAIAQVIIDVHAKRLPPRIATSVAPLLNTLLRALDTEEQDKRLRRLEEKLNILELATGERLQAGIVPPPGSGSMD